MDNETMIWQFLDGNLSPSEKIHFEQLIKQDDPLKNDLDRCTLLHQQLQSNNLTPAPAQLFDQIMSKAKGESIVDFSLKPLLIKLIPSLIFIILAVLMIQNQMDVVYTEEQVSNVFLDVSATLEPYYSLLTIICVPFLLLLGFDNLLKRWFRNNQLSQRPM